MLSKIKTEPFLKWTGGKGQLLSQYQPYLPKTFNNYYELFLGGGALFFHLQPHNSFLADINHRLINTYRWVRDDVEAVILELKSHAQNHSETYYSQIRLEYNQSKSLDLEQAARLIYLNKTCFNGLYRENSNGVFNVAIGKYEKLSICQEEKLWQAAKVLAGVTLEIGTYSQFLHKLQPGDFVYLDPPYVPISSTSNFTTYSPEGFGQFQHLLLKEDALKLHGRGVKVLISNSECEFVRQIYSEQCWKIESVSAARSINSKTNARGKISEIIIRNY
ncbi:MAG TPA: DNA adenine methylase [Nostocaceae cyanobacterium]|nr:DNA adenine methylase [Nostocaceae cyanobacterium]